MNWNIIAALVGVEQDYRGDATDAFGHCCRDLKITHMLDCSLQIKFLAVPLVQKKKASGTGNFPATLQIWANTGPALRIAYRNTFLPG